MSDTKENKNKSKKKKAKKKTTDNGSEMSVLMDKDESENDTKTKKKKKKKKGKNSKVKEVSENEEQNNDETENKDSQDNQDNQNNQNDTKNSKKKKKKKKKQKNKKKNNDNKDENEKLDTKDEKKTESTKQKKKKKKKDKKKKDNDDENDETSNDEIIAKKKKTKVSDKKSKRKKPEQSEASDDSDVSTFLTKCKSIPCIGDVLEFILIPACKPISKLCNELFPEDIENIQDNEWQWSPQDSGEIVLYISTFLLFLFSIIHTIGQTTVEIKDLENGIVLDIFFGFPNWAMAFVLLPVCLFDIIYVCIKSKYKHITSLHYYVPLFNWFWSSLLFFICVSTFDINKTKMDLKCVSNESDTIQRELTDSQCNEWHGSYRVAVAGLSGIIINMFLIGVASIFRRNAIVKVSHLNDHFRMPSTVSGEQQTRFGDINNSDTVSVSLIRPPQHVDDISFDQSEPTYQSPPTPTSEYEEEEEDDRDDDDNDDSDNDSDKGGEKGSSLLKINMPSLPSFKKINMPSLPKFKSKHKKDENENSDDEI